MLQRDRRQGMPVQETADGRLAAPAVEQMEQVVESGAGIERRERVVTDSAGGGHSERLVRDVASEQLQRLLQVSQLVYLCFGIVEALIGVRVLLKLIAANPDNTFARFVYNTSAVFLAPFFGLTGSPVAGGSVLEVSSLVAMAVYAFLGWGVIKVVWLLFNRSMTQSLSTYDRFRS
jgi:YggT family protein